MIVSRGFLLIKPIAIVCIKKWGDKLMRKTIFRKVATILAVFSVVFSSVIAVNAANTQFSYVPAGGSAYSNNHIVFTSSGYHYKYYSALNSFKFGTLPQNASPTSYTKIHVRIYYKNNGSYVADGDVIDFQTASYSLGTALDGYTWGSSYIPGGRPYYLKTNSNYSSLDYGCNVTWYFS